MLTFITLSNTIKNSLPKVSYTKFVDVWLFICTTFIFLSLVEFAFVNTIHRRRCGEGDRRTCSVTETKFRAHCMFKANFLQELNTLFIFIFLFFV